jgi:hypothetical protein
MARLFTLEEARSILPSVRQIVTALQEAKHALDRQMAALEALMERSGANGHGEASQTEARKGTEVAAERVDRLIQELIDLGVEMKGIEQGLVDFPSMREGRIVYLCWRLGEDDISYWHEVDAGFAGRQPL